MTLTWSNNMNKKVAEILKYVLFFGCLYYGGLMALAFILIKSFKVDIVSIIKMKLMKKLTYIFNKTA